MPPRARRSKKPPPPPKELTEEEQQRRDQCDLLLNDFDKQVEALQAEAAREKKATCDGIDMIFKLDLMKLPADTKSMNWEEYCRQQGMAATLGTSHAVASALEDSVMEVVNSKVSGIKSAMKSVTTTKKPRGRKKSAQSEGEEPATADRPSRARRTKAALETPGRRGASCETPAGSRVPPGAARTPMITPKFDTSSRLNRTVSRAAKAGEVLVSLSGSPVAPTVQARSKAGKEVASQAQIPLGGGTALHVPLGAEAEDPDLATAEELDAEQVARLEQLHRNLGAMLAVRGQARHEDA